MVVYVLTHSPPSLVFTMFSLHQAELRAEEERKEREEAETRNEWWWTFGIQEHGGRWWFPNIFLMFTGGFKYVFMFTPPYLKKKNNPI